VGTKVLHFHVQTFNFQPLIIYLGCIA